jgi:hypothetical protein
VLVSDSQELQVLDIDCHTVTSRLMQWYHSRLLFRSYSVRIPVGLSAILTEVHRGFPHSLQANTEIVSKKRF